MIRAAEAIRISGKRYAQDGAWSRIAMVKGGRWWTGIGWPGSAATVVKSRWGTAVGWSARIGTSLVHDCGIF